MGLIDNVNFSLTLCWREIHLLSDVAYFIDSPVAGGVEFNDIHELAAVYGPAIITGVTGVAILSVKAIYCLGYDPCCGGFTTTSGTAEQVRVRHSAWFQRLAECAGDMILSNQLAEAGRSPLAVEDLSGRRGLRYSLAGHRRLGSIIGVSPY